MMKNVPNDQFWCFKWRNKVQNRNLCEKLSKIGRFGNFNFWSKVYTKVKFNKGQSQLVKTVKGQLLANVLHGPGWFRVKSQIKLQSRWCHHDNVALTWTRANMARACMALANVNKWCHGWHQKNVDILLRRMHGTWRRRRMTGSLEQQSNTCDHNPIWESRILAMRGRRS